MSASFGHFNISPTFLIPSSVKRNLSSDSVLFQFVLVNPKPPPDKHERFFRLDGSEPEKLCNAPPEIELAGR